MPFLGLALRPLPQQEGGVGGKGRKEVPVRFRGRGQRDGAGKGGSKKDMGSHGGFLGSEKTGGTGAGPPGLVLELP